VELAEKYKIDRILEVGCGFGHLTARLQGSGLDALGIDIAPTAIEKAKHLYPTGNFFVGDCTDISLMERLSPDIVILSEVTWYILPKLKEFLTFLQSYAQQRTSKVFLIHILSIYESGDQKYGTDFFVDLSGILNFFNLNFLEYGQISSVKDNGTISSGTFFVGEI
jgi:SAM-dependent methyltransferase